MSRRFGFFLVWALLTLLIAGGAAGIAYNAGTMAAVSAASGGAYLVHPYWGYGFGFFPFFGLFPLFGFLFFLLILFWIFGGRRRWYGGGWQGGYGPQGPHGHGVPPAFEEWHRRAHGEQPAQAGDQPPRQA